MPYEVYVTMNSRLYSRYLSPERAQLVHPSGVSELPLGHHLLLLLAGGSLFFFVLLLVRVRACTQRTAPQASAAPSRVSAGRGGFVRSAVADLSWLGVACVPRHKGSMNGLCLASRCRIEDNSTNVPWYPFYSRSL